MILLILFPQFRDSFPLIVNAAALKMRDSGPLTGGDAPPKNRDSGPLFLTCSEAVQQAEYQNVSCPRALPRNTQNDTIQHPANPACPASPPNKAINK